MTLRNRALLTLATLGTGYFLALSALPLHLPSVCLFKRLTGLPCPGCNMTHACCALARGHFHDALNYHLAIIPFALITCTAALLLAAEALTNRPLLDRLWKKSSTPIIFTSLAFLFTGWIINLHATLSLPHT